MALLGGAVASVAPVSSASPAGPLPLLVAVFVQGCGVGGAIPITEALIVEYYDEAGGAVRGWWACLVSLGWPLGSVLSTAISWILVPGGKSPGSRKSNSSFVHSPSPRGVHTAGWQTAYSAQGGMHGWPGVYIVLSVVNFFAFVLLLASLPESPIFFKMQRELAAATEKESNKLGALQDVSSGQRRTHHKKEDVRSQRLTCTQIYTWVLVCAIWFAVSFSGNGFAVTLPLFLNGKNHASAVSAGPPVFAQLMLWSVVGIPGVFIAAWAVEARSLGRKRVVVISSLLTAVCFFMFTLCHSPLAATLTSSAQNVVVMCCWAGIATLTSELAPTTHRAQLLGVSNMVKALAGIFGPYVGGFFVSSQPVIPLLVFSGVMIVGAIAGMLLPKDTRGQKLANDWSDGGGSQVGALAEFEQGLLHGEASVGS